MFSPSFWVSRTADANQVLLTPAQIKTRNSQTLAEDQNLADLAKFGPTVRRSEVLALVNALASPFKTRPVDASGRPLPEATLASMKMNRNLGAIPAVEKTRFGMAVGRTLLRVYPTTVAAFPASDATDFDSFAAGALFPGDAVVILNRSQDNRWLLVQTWQGPGWAPSRNIAEGSREATLSYATRAPFRVITGAEVRTVHTPEAPEVSELQLDMGTRIPLKSLPPDKPVNGAGPYEAWTIDLPTRDPVGSLRFRPALLQRIHSSASDYLPLTRANIIDQAFKFLGERYGWGHTFNGRDCSGFTSDVYRSFGILMPSNSGAQGASPAFRHQLFTARSSHEDRLKAVMAADVGDLLVVPGHVMMILGKVDGQPYVIQDVPYVIYRDPKGVLHKTKVNEVSVTPLLPLLFSDTQTYVDAMTSLVEVNAL
jgi:cell wall-associated NlpC family hydrolase